ncbi:Polynucleotide 5'-hydroxyl-kinase NOL9 [Histomonas meleagridis]|uniref:Polynucleotide 5'-hydroxyl-kinase NOL9 n=1 Tax=Histomonas meleagridis TaxID=135588 RepID=UPI00355AC5DF|nr:Polynucleotide 5'-hydroxyl-kinase NOL9 [Histomonas meleagridis]KAH0796339.1 Polynucleotide 5'-hydroxyl-kinase NOL9 [Histomonas meleagridis]
MAESVLLEFNGGIQSFYGAMEITVSSGNPVIHGAALSQGYSNHFFAPVYTLPITFESNIPFTLRISPIPKEQIAPTERSFYFPRNTPEGFNKIFEGVFHSPIIKGPTYPQATDRFLNSLSKKNPTKIFVAGNKSSGKSTFSKYIINKLINTQQSVYFLDLDPGQPELFLPGTISLTTITNYLFNPPEFNSMLAKKVFFVGTTSLPENLDYYMTCVSELLKEIPNDAFVVINSFGWVKDLGLILHQNLIKMINPGVTFMLHSVDEVPASINNLQFQVEINPRSGPLKISPKVHRETRIATFFRRGFNGISTQQPIVVPLSDVRICFLCCEVAPCETLTALNGSLVALCNDTRPFMPPRTKVSLLRMIPPIECNGMGIVRAIDKENGIIYIITPNPNIEFNTLVQGLIYLPSEVFTETLRADANFIGVGILDKVGASTDPLQLKNTPVFD